MGLPNTIKTANMRRALHHRHEFTPRAIYEDMTAMEAEVLRAQLGPNLTLIDIPDEVWNLFAAVGDPNKINIHRYEPIKDDKRPVRFASEKE